MPKLEARRQLSLPDCPILVSVGHISPRKGFHRVIRSLPHLLSTFPDARLIIVGGKGAEENNTPQLHALVEQLGLSENVVFVGAKPPDEIAVWLGASDVFVLASDYEGCPNVVLEAMSCGRPVVATKVGDIERMVPSFAGVLFEDPEDHAKLAQCLKIALAQDWDPQQIRSHVARRSWHEVAKQVLAEWKLARQRFTAGDSNAPSTSIDAHLQIARKAN